MRHQVHTKKLQRSSGHRKALYRNLSQSLIEYERITTTLVKAKAIRPVVEKLVTRAKDQNLAARRAIGAFLPTEDAADKLYTVLAPRFANRSGGYTRIIKIGRRVGDGTEMAVVEFVELSAPSNSRKAASVAKKSPTKPASRKRTPSKAEKKEQSQAEGEQG